VLLMLVTVSQCEQWVSIQFCKIQILAMATLVKSTVIDRDDTLPKSTLKMVKNQ
jgi:hypothetical protein